MRGPGRDRDTGRRTFTVAVGYNKAALSKGSTSVWAGAGSTANMDGSGEGIKCHALIFIHNEVTVGVLHAGELKHQWNGRRRILVDLHFDAIDDSVHEL